MCGIGAYTLTPPYGWYSTDPASFQIQSDHWADEAEEPEENRANVSIILSLWLNTLTFDQRRHYACCIVLSCILTGVKPDCYQGLALHECDLSPEVGDSHGDCFSIEAVRRVPHQSNSMRTWKMMLAHIHWNDISLKIVQKVREQPINTIFHKVFVAVQSTLRMSGMLWVWQGIAVAGQNSGQATWCSLTAPVISRR